MNKTPLISVIVPAYNAEKTIEKCVNSILKSTYNNIEVVVVNDGSSDNTWDVCKRLNKEDNRVIILNKKNGGVSVARNEGIRICRGEQICFVDSDDYISNDMIMELYKRKEKDDSQLSICEYYYVYDEGKKEKVEMYESDSIESREKYFINMSHNLHSLFYGVLWNKMYDAKIIRKYSIQFRKNVDLGEDVIFNLDYISRANQISIIAKPFYYYNRINDFSLSKKKSTWESWILTKERFRYGIDKYKEMNLYERCKVELNNAFAIELINPTFYLANNSSNRKEATMKLECLYKEKGIKEVLYNSKINTYFFLIVKMCVFFKAYHLLYFLIMIHSKTERMLHKTYARNEKEIH